MYIVLGAHVCENCDGPIPAYYGSYSNLTLAQRAVRRAYLQIVHGVTEEEAATYTDMINAEYMEAAQRDATAVSLLAYEFPQRVAETDTIWIVLSSEWNEGVN